MHARGPCMQKVDDDVSHVMRVCSEVCSMPSEDFASYMKDLPVHDRGLLVQYASLLEDDYVKPYLKKGAAVAPSEKRASRASMPRLKLHRASTASQAHGSVKKMSQVGRTPLCCHDSATKASLVSSAPPHSPTASIRLAAGRRGAGRAILRREDRRRNAEVPRSRPRRQPS